MTYPTQRLVASASSYPTLTAAEFRAQGTTPAEVLSIAKASRDPSIARRLRSIAYDMGLPRRRGANDNRRRDNRRAA